MKLNAPDNCGGLRADGTAFAVAADGTIDVPPHLVPIAKSHGFTDVVVAAKRARKGAAEAENGEA